MLKMPAESQKKMMFDVLSGLADMHQGELAAKRTMDFCPQW